MWRSNTRSCRCEEAISIAVGVKKQSPLPCTVDMPTSPARNASWNSGHDSQNCRSPSVMCPSAYIILYIYICIFCRVSRSCVYGFEGRDIGRQLFMNFYEVFNRLLRGRNDWRIQGRMFRILNQFCVHVYLFYAMIKIRLFETIL